MGEQKTSQESVFKDNPGGEMISPVPAPAMKSIEEQVNAAGGEFREPEEYEGSLGRTMFDSPVSRDGTVTILLPKGNIERFPRQSLVRIKSVEDQRLYIGTVVSGPFAEPDGLRADANILVSVNVKGALLMPSFHGRVQVEILGEEMEDGAIVPPRRRPLPNSPVFVLNKEDTVNKLRLNGNLQVGVIHGQEDVEIRVPHDQKSVLPRHLGILGTTGGGKSTTVAGIVGQLQATGYATIIFDTEGEYTAINQETDDPTMITALARRSLGTRGLNDTHVYCLVNREPRNADHPDVRHFRINFSMFSPHAVKEILELSPAQELRFLQTYDVCKRVMRDCGIYPERRNRDEEAEALQIDELDQGYPRMTLSMLIDIAKAFYHVVSGETGNPDLYNQPFQECIGTVMSRVRTVRTDHEGSWRALLARLWTLHRLRILDNVQAESLNYDELIQPGRVSIIDLSDSDSSYVNNLVIAQVLRGVQEQQEANYRAALEGNERPTATMILIEEAHEFLSAQRIRDMQVLFQQVARIARRGRKRWLGLGFITQLPQHLPDEVLGLINNWILHKINDSNVISRLKRSIGGIDESHWDMLPRLAPGQAVVSFTSMARPLLASIDPAPCKLLMIE